jgi:hypothetical protein
MAGRAGSYTAVPRGVIRARIVLLAARQVADVAIRVPGRRCGHLGRWRWRFVTEGWRGWRTGRGRGGRAGSMPTVAGIKGDGPTAGRGAGGAVAVVECGGAGRAGGGSSIPLQVVRQVNGAAAVTRLWQPGYLGRCRNRCPSRAWHRRKPVALRAGAQQHLGHRQAHQFGAGQARGPAWPRGRCAGIM